MHSFLLQPTGAKQDVFVITKTHLELPNLNVKYVLEIRIL